MTIEIRQLVLRAVVEERRDPGLPAGLHVGPVPAHSVADQGSRGPAVDLDALRGACVREVKREIRKARSR
jgi:hypothetical protein